MTAEQVALETSVKTEVTTGIVSMSLMVSWFQVVSLVLYHRAAEWSCYEWVY